MRMFVPAVLCAIAFSAVAQSSGYYEQIQYRDNDPFVFCTQGQKNMDKCWIPLPPYTGNYMMMPHCNPPNQYGKSWTNDDWASLYQYLRVCPQAMESGAWEGQGRPEQTPNNH